MRATMLIAALLLGSATALPRMYNESTICEGGMCDQTLPKYEQKAPIQPGYQWDDAGGYCGSWASQRSFLNQGAWISQQQVRDHTSRCSGPSGEHDHEILSCNIEEAWDNLKIDYERFDYNGTALPQVDAYAKWLKKQLVAGYVVAWMIMWSGQAYPIYNLTAPAGMYGHVEPVVGIQSNHPLTDPTVYDDDVVLHFNDGGIQTVHRPIASLPCKWAGPGKPADCGKYKYGISYPYGFGWAAKGFTQDPKSGSAAPASLAVDPWMREPDTRSGQKPDAMTGTLTARDLTAGAAYDIYRWDTVAEAFTYTPGFRKTTFTATADTHVYADETTFQSDGTTYYRVVKAQQ